MATKVMTEHLKDLQFYLSQIEKLLQDMAAEVEKEKDHA